MMPSKDDEALVDLLDVILRDGVILRADVIISVAEIPLVGLKLTAALAGMDTMTEYGLFEEWDLERRRSAISGQQHSDSSEHEKHAPVAVGHGDESGVLEEENRPAPESNDQNGG